MEWNKQHQNPHPLPKTSNTDGNEETTKQPPLEPGEDEDLRLIGDLPPPSPKPNVSSSHSSLSKTISTVSSTGNDTSTTNVCQTTDNNSNTISVVSTSDSSVMITCSPTDTANKTILPSSSDHSNDICEEKPVILPLSSTNSNRSLMSTSSCTQIDLTDEQPVASMGLNSTNEDINNQDDDDTHMSPDIDIRHTITNILAHAPISTRSQSNTPSNTCTSNNIQKYINSSHADCMGRDIFAGFDEDAFRTFVEISTSKTISKNNPNKFPDFRDT